MDTSNLEFNAPVRHIDASVDILYGNEETSKIERIKASQTGSPTNTNDLFGPKNNLGYKAFTLEGHPLDEGRGLIDKFGWWGTVLSKENADSEFGDYPFPEGEEPRLLLKFGNGRLMRKIDIFGDADVDEFPSRFKITLYDVEMRRVYSRTFTNNTQVQFPAILQDDGAYLSNIKWIRLKLIAWNKPGRLSKIYRFYDDIKETYRQGNLKEFEVIHEKVNNGEIKYGLCSDTCRVTLLNENRKFDKGYLRPMVHLNKTVKPYINGKQLGHFYIKEWSISQDGMFVKCSANDRLLDFQNIVYEGRMPQINGPQRVSFYDMFDNVLKYAQKKYGRNFEYTIAESLYDYDAEPYIKRESIWSVLQKLCSATLSHVYINEEDVLIVESALPQISVHNDNLNARQTFKTSAYLEDDNDIALDMDLINADSAGENEEIGAKIIKIDPDNAFAIDKPYFADMVANVVEIGYVTKSVADNPEKIIEISEIIAEGKTDNSNGINEEVFDISDFYEITDSFLPEIDNISYDYDTCGLGIKLVITNKNATNVKIEGISFIGKKIGFDNKKIIIRKDNVNIGDTNNAFTSAYSHPDCELIQKSEDDEVPEAYATLLANVIIGAHPEETKTATVNWRGNPNLSMNKEFTIEDRNAVSEEEIDGEKIKVKEIERYKCTYSKIVIQGGMKQDSKGIFMEKVKETMKKVKETID